MMLLPIYKVDKNIKGRFIIKLTTKTVTAEQKFVMLYIRLYKRDI